MPAGEGKPGGKSRNTRVRGVPLGLSLIISAFLMALSLASPQHAWVGWITLLPLFLAIRVLRPWHALAAGALWGLGLFAFGTAAFDTGIHTNAMSLVLLTCVPAAYAALACALTRRIGFSPYVLGVSWMAVELALIPVGIRGGLLAVGPGDGTLLHWIGEALGYVLVAFLVAWTNALLVVVLSAACDAISLPVYMHRPAECHTVLAPQTFSCFPLYAVPVARPRAPPTFPHFEVT